MYLFPYFWKFFLSIIQIFIKILKIPCVSKEIGNHKISISDLKKIDFLSSNWYLASWNVISEVHYIPWIYFRYRWDSKYGFVCVTATAVLARNTRNTRKMEYFFVIRVQMERKTIRIKTKLYSHVFVIKTNCWIHGQPSIHLRPVTFLRKFHFY
jgi:hypothetical protein